MKLYLLYRLGLWLNAVLPPRCCVRLAQHLSDWRARWAPVDRAMVRSNLSLIMSAPVAEGDSRVNEVFRHFGWYLMEFFGGRRHPFLITTTGYHHLRSASHVHRGRIMLTGHIGNWELGAVFLRRAGFPMSVVALAHTNRRINRLFDDQRRRSGVEVIPVGPHTASRCLRVLQRGHLLGLVADRDYGTDGVAVEFLGRQWMMPRGPAVLSLRAGAPVLPTFIIRQTPGSLHLFIEPPIWPPEGPWDEQHVVQLTQTYAQVIERYVRQFPTQWLMFQALQP